MRSARTFSSNQDLTAPHPVDSRKAVYKIFSDTLKSTSFGTSDSRSSISKSNLSRVNKKSPRTLAAGGFKPFPPPPGNSRSSHAAFFARRPPTPKTLNDLKRSRASNSKSKLNKNESGGGGEGNYFRRSSTAIPRESSTGSQRSSGPSSMKDCHLNNVLRSAKRCISQLRDAKDRLSDIVARDEQLSHGIKKTNPTEDQIQLAHVAYSITYLCREAFVPAHRLNQTAIALYNAEDFLRYPSDTRVYDSSAKRRIQLPDPAFNEITVAKLREVVDLAAATFNRFNGKGRMGEELQEILFSVLRGYQDFYAAILGCQEIFKVLLYAGQKEKAHLQQFLLALSSMERSDLLVEIQDLRRIVDEIVIFLEKLSWGSFVIYRLAGGENSNSGEMSNIPSDDSFPAAGKLSTTSVNPTYPAYPLLRQKVLIKKKKKKAEGNSNEANYMSTKE